MTAFYFGDNFDEVFIASNALIAGEQLKALKLYTPNLPPYGRTPDRGLGGDILYLCAHGSPDELGGYSPTALLGELYAKSLDRRRFHTFFLIACSVADLNPNVNHDGRVFVQELYRLMQSTPAFKDLNVKGYRGPLLHYFKRQAMRAPTIERSVVVLPGGREVTREEATITLGPKHGAYVPPTIG